MKDFELKFGPVDLGIEENYEDPYENVRLNSSESEDNNSDDDGSNS